MDIMLTIFIVAALLMLGIVFWFMIDGKTNAHPEVNIHFERQKEREHSR